MSFYYNAEARGEIVSESEFVSFPVNVSLSDGLSQPSTYRVHRDFNRMYLMHNIHYRDFFAVRYLQQKLV